MIIGTIVQTASHSVGQFIGARFLIGFGLTFAANAAPCLVTELAYPSQRAPLTSLYNCLWYSGAIVAAWTTYGSFRMNGSWSWRLPSALQGLPSIIQICLMWFCPESPRWLIGRGRDAEALRILAYYHASGNDQDPLVQFEYNEIKEAIALDQAAKEQVSWADLFKTPGNRRRMRIIIALAFFSQWSGNGLVSYYLSKVLDSIGITDPGTQNLINGILQVRSLSLVLLLSLHTYLLHFRSTTSLLLSSGVSSATRPVAARSSSHPTSACSSSSPAKRSPPPATPSPVTREPPTPSSHSSSSTMVPTTSRTRPSSSLTPSRSCRSNSAPRASPSSTSPSRSRSSSINMPTPSPSRPSPGSTT